MEGKKKNITHTRETLRIYAKQVRRYPFIAFISVIFTMAASSMAAVIPLYFKKFFDTFTLPGSPENLGRVLISILTIVAALEMARWLFWRIALLSQTYYYSRVMAALSALCFSYLHGHSFAYFNNNFVGSLVKRVNWFTRAFETLADQVMFSLLPLLVDTAIIFYVLVHKNVFLGIAIGVWIVLFSFVNWLITKYKLRFDIEFNEAETEATGILADTITNHANVKLFRGFEREVVGFEKVLQKVRRLKSLTWNLDNLFDSTQTILVIGLEMGVFYLAIRLWQRGILTIGDFVLLQAYVIIIFEKVWDLGKVIRRMYSALADAEEMTVVLLTPHEIQDVHGAKPLVVSKGAIEFANVDFYYHETRKIFSKFNLTIQAKQKIALVGPSGAGKSTVVKLLLRMHDLSRGKILIDGARIDRVTQHSLWSAISLVPQDPILFHRTLMENIRYGKPEATDEEVYAAAKKAHCHEFIDGFPEKYQTYVGERGVKLSGGERQRVAIARAVLRNAPILILDEATSSLDSESESLIQDALNNLMKDKTVIVVAHRLSTIMKMDRILVIDGGRVIEDGSHTQLLKKKKGLYSKLWNLQAGGFIA